VRLLLTENELAIRDEVRDFLATSKPSPEEIPEGFEERFEFLRGWQRQLHEAGLVGLTWPRQYGGRGATLMEQIVASQEMALAGAPPLVGYVGVEVLGPSLIAHGTGAQKERFVDRILSAEEIWCQGFSEPEAGSDLASLRTRAVDQGDHFLLSGQKTWTSYAQLARWCAVLARTDADAAPHRGISYLIVDLRSPGVEVRPLLQVTGDAEFGEVFFDDVVVPRENLLGDLNQGWGIAMHTLAHERGPYAMRRQVELRVMVDRLVDLAQRVPREGRPAIECAEIRTELGRAHIAVEVLKHQCYRSVGQAIAQGQPGFESSVDKILLAQTEQRVTAAALEMLGPYAAMTDGSHWDDLDLDGVQHDYLYGRAGSVYGGTAQIQRNIVAERILGLPRD
jgi:alkylation response protein AidB-like acyl-CoA dehydrogenase